MRKWVWDLLLLELSTLNIKSIFSLRASFANKPCLSHSVEMPSFEVWASTCKNSLFTEKLGTVLQCEYELQKIYINQILLYKTNSQIFMEFWRCFCKIVLFFFQSLEHCAVQPKGACCCSTYVFELNFCLLGLGINFWNIGHVISGLVMH